MRLAEVVEASGHVRRASGRLAKIAQLADCLSRAAPDEVEAVVAWLSGVLPQGRIGVGPAALRALRDVPAAPAPRLPVREVDERLSRIARITGPGSAAKRRDALGGLLAEAGPDEQDFLVRLLLGELRQGALEGVVVEALARAADAPAAAVRRAWMLDGDLGRVACAALTEGRAGLAGFGVRLFQPLKPMLASPADSVEEALARLGEAAFEWKLDGARIQVHRAGDDVRVFSRRLRDVSDSVPEIVEAVRALPISELILDGEAIALRADGRPQPFQTTMRRFGRKLEVAALREALPLRSWFFDCLYARAETLLDAPAEDRFRVLADALPSDLAIPRLVTADAERARHFAAGALRRGHEGVMAKATRAAYAAGARGRDWLKLKPAHTLDLIVLAAEWGSGRRRGWLSNLHLGARDPASGEPVMLGKTFKGLTDEMLRWQTEALLAREIRRDAYTVYVRPELVVEVALSGVQTSPHYPAGLALRFARVKRHRPDKRAEDADGLDVVRAIHAAATAAA